ncbi:MAG: Na+-transporting NADH:ubiquinone oxidoreductase subunit C [Paraglaciecola sp.]|jgi:Na+-transporting NADH:ubiquinone oxidoreductase subunit C
MESNKKVISFVLAMCVIVSLVLALMVSVTGPIAKKNEEIFNKRAVLKAVESKLGGGMVADLSDQEVLDLFDNKMEQKIIKAYGAVVESGELRAEDINMAKEKKKVEADRQLPLFIYDGEEGKNYILAVRGSGLWDEIWGYIALESDLNTIAGATFDHKGETPGLGAEITDNPQFAKSFVGKKIYNQNGKYVSVKVKKGGADPDNMYAVDGISGATVTADGVEEMLQRGIEYYDSYFEGYKESVDAGK